MTKPTLYLMLGFPGAGKTTTAETVSEITGAVRLSSDDLRISMFPSPKFTQAEHDIIYGALDYLTELLLTKGISVIYDANLNRYRHRKDKYDICTKTDAKPVLLWVKADQQLAKHRATAKGEGDPRRPYGNLRPEVFDRLANQIESPEDNEPAIVVNGTKVSPDYIKQLINP